tara:strand:+ start:1303 stop:1569 length:267 start_codon:yes stop_codon:yes gene_type:complete
MEKIIFFSLVIPILAFVLYLGGRAIMNGFNAKEANRSLKEEDKGEKEENTMEENINLSEELSKLNDLREKGILTQEEFDKAKDKLLNQ